MMRIPIFPRFPIILTGTFTVPMTILRMRKRRLMRRSRRLRRKYSRLVTKRFSLSRFLQATDTSRE